MTVASLWAATTTLTVGRVSPFRTGLGDSRASAATVATSAEKLERMARRIYRALHLSGYARIDFRLRPDGSLFALEANPNPNLARDEDFAAAARAAGIDYPALLERILRLGRDYRAEWRA